MVINTTEDSVASLEKWIELRDKAAELDKSESKFDIQVDSKGHCLYFGNQDDELQRFDELARWAAKYLGHADLKGEVARDFLAVLLMDYFIKQTTLRQEVGLVGDDDWAVIELPFKAAKIYFGHLASDAPLAQRSNDESPTVASEEQESETTQPITVEGIKTLLEACKGVIDKETLKKKRREAVELWQQLRKSIGKKATKKALYDHFELDPSEFFKWQRGEHLHGSMPDIDIRSALTADPHWDPLDDDLDREDPDWDF